MILISHRGNLKGPNSETENTQEQIDKVINAGYDCEIDIWQKDELIFLGHDKPQNVASRYKLINIKDRLWVHAKNKEVIEWLIKEKFNFFWHDKDAFTITANGNVWCYPSKEVFNFGINLMPEWNKIQKKKLINCAGICSDFIERYK